jgi:hypothetical protein
VAEPTVWRYSLPNVSGEGWAIAFLDAIGCFAVLSDWGNYGYRWPQAGWGPGDFRDFFARCDDSYIIRKLSKADHYDPEQTEKNVKARILESRRHGSWSRERAREEWSLLDLCGVGTRDEFAVWYQHTEIDEAYECASHDHGSDAQGFIRHVMPRLRAAILAQRETEAA